MKRDKDFITSFITLLLWLKKKKTAAETYWFISETWVNSNAWRNNFKCW